MPRSHPTPIPHDIHDAKPIIPVYTEINTRIPRIHAIPNASIPHHPSRSTPPIHNPIPSCPSNALSHPPNAAKYTQSKTYQVRRSRAAPTIPSCQPTPPQPFQAAISRPRSQPTWIPSHPSSPHRNKTTILQIHATHPMRRPTGRRPRTPHRCVAVHLPAIKNKRVDDKLTKRRDGELL